MTSVLIFVGSGQAPVFNVGTVTEFQQALIGVTNKTEDDTINVAAGNYDIH